MPDTLSEALLQELPDMPEEFKTRLLKVVREWDNGEYWRKLKRDQDARTQRFYERFIKNGDLVFDIGANIGERTEIFRALGAKVVAVEPHPDCVRVLNKKFSDDPNVTVVPRALGNHVGIGTLITGERSGISSLSSPWIEAVRESNRFGEYQWDRKCEVELDTLDFLVSQYGIPSFIKIDVEGFEDQVLSGLSTPVHSLSFEFNTEFLISTEACVRKLEKLGPVKFSYSTKETMELHPEWLTGDEVLGYLDRYKHDNKMYGDVYARFA
jgi:FkbM family methyltransferase